MRKTNLSKIRKSNCYGRSDNTLTKLEGFISITNTNISIHFRELDEIIEELVSKMSSDITDNDITHDWAALIKNLNLFKSEIKLASMEQMEMALVDNEPMAYNLMEIYELLHEMMEQNDCYLATKVYRVLIKLFGKTFQGIANLMCT